LIGKLLKNDKTQRLDVTKLKYWSILNKVNIVLLSEIYFYHNVSYFLVKFIVSDVYIIIVNKY